jgi:hypothetical protein
MPSPFTVLKPRTIAGVSYKAGDELPVEVARKLRNLAQLIEHRVIYADPAVMAPPSEAPAPRGPEPLLPLDTPVERNVARAELRSLRAERDRLTAAGEPVPVRTTNRIKAYESMLADIARATRHPLDPERNLKNAGELEAYDAALLEEGDGGEPEVEELPEGTIPTAEDGNEDAPPADPADDPGEEAPPADPTGEEPGDDEDELAAASAVVPDATPPAATTVTANLPPTETRQGGRGRGRGR